MFLSKREKCAIIVFFWLSYMTPSYTIYTCAAAFLFFLKDVFQSDKEAWTAYVLLSVT